jgi:hypothetical protein
LVLQTVWLSERGNKHLVVKRTANVCETERGRIGE